MELFGHQCIAGRVTTRTFGSNTFFQVNVIREDGETIYTRLFSTSAVFSITPVTKEYCVKWEARQHRTDTVPFLPILEPEEAFEG